MTNLTYTTEQLAVIEAAPTTSLLVRARAGAAKTTTLIALASALPQFPPLGYEPPLYLAFNRAIADDIKGRMPAKVTTSTFHAYGLSLLKLSTPKIKISSRKYNDMLSARGIVGDEYDACMYCIEAIRNHNLALDTNAVAHIIDEADAIYDCRPDATILFEVLHAGLADKSTIDFTDMLWQVVRSPKTFRPHSHLLIDEAQDTNPLQLAYLKRVRSESTLLYFVGDDRQSIYAFRGASHTAMDDILRTFAPLKELYLTTSFRCATSIIDLAKRIVPDIQARPNAPVGIVDTLPYATSLFRGNAALVVCRNNAPLAKLASDLIKAAIPFSMKSEWFKQQTRFITARASASASIPAFLNKLTMWEDEQLTAFPSRAESVTDRADALRALATSLPPDATVSSLLLLLEKIANAKGANVLSTIHKAKGLESDTVYFLRPDLLPSRYATTPSDLRQEDNLWYVAVTRAKNTLIFLDNKAAAV